MAAREEVGGVGTGSECAGVGGETSREIGNMTWQDAVAL